MDVTRRLRGSFSLRNESVERKRPLVIEGPPALLLSNLLAAEALELEVLAEDASEQRPKLLVFHRREHLLDLVKVLIGKRWGLGRSRLVRGDSRAGTLNEANVGHRRGPAVEVRVYFFQEHGLDRAEFIHPDRGIRRDVEDGTADPLGPCVPRYCWRNDPGPFVDDTLPSNRRAEARCLEDRSQEALDSLGLFHFGAIGPATHGAPGSSGLGG